MDATTLYSSKADKYAKYRWDYAPQAIQTILDATHISNEFIVADIGAGTGILTKHFVDRVKLVLGIEPNAEMRRVATERLGQYPSCRIIAGYAESIPLQGRCVDLITVAQAIHWFEPEPTRAEFLRILKLGGWLAVLRNYSTDGELTSALEGLFTEENGVDTLQTIGLPARKLVDYYYNNGDSTKVTFSFTLQQTWAEFMGSLATASYMPDEDNPLYVNLENAAKRVFDRFSSDGVLDVHGTTELYLGQVEQVRRWTC